MRAYLILLFPLLLPLTAVAQDAPRLIVEGRGEVAVVPDVATISVSVTREADTAETAMEDLAVATEAVLERIAAEGIAARDVQTGQISLQPDWDRPDDRAAPRISGYVARTVLTVRVRALDRLGSAMTAVVSDGANGLNGLSFEVAEPRPAEDAARRAAFADAMAKARLYAEAAGMSVGPIVTLREGGAQTPRPMGGPQMEAARSMPVAPGEVTQTVTVTLEIELAPAD